MNNEVIEPMKTAVKNKEDNSAAKGAHEGYSRVLVIGAGEAGEMIIREIEKKGSFLKKTAVAVVDDDVNKQGREVAGVRVYGATEDIADICRDFNITEIIFSIANIKSLRKKEILDTCKLTGCKIKTIPGIYEIIDGKVEFKNVKDVDIEDLLGRVPVELDIESIESFINDKIILITGGGGSIGSEISRQISRFKPKELILLDNNENNLYAITQELKMSYGDKIKLSAVVANIREPKRLEKIFDRYKPQVLFHAAAHKHVPLMENNKTEAVKNNIFATVNLIELSIKYGVEKFVAISTDKAVNPTNIMGATKRATEILIQAYNGTSDTEFAAVRFGNVLGSNGSVIPLFKKQIERGGPVTVTHREIIRYFMTIPEAASLVLEAGAMARGGEVFVLDMGNPVRIVDLAENLIKLSGFVPGEDIEIVFTGLREGEKLYEELLMDEEGIQSTPNRKIFIGNPQSFDKDKINEYVDRLREAVDEEDDDRVDDIMREFVPTYVTPESVNFVRKS